MILKHYPNTDKFKKGYLVPHINLKIINSSWGTPKLNKDKKVKGIQMFLLKKVEKIKKGLFNKIIYADYYDEIWIAEIKFNLLDKIGDNDKFSFQYPHNWNIKEKIKVSNINRIETIKESDFREKKELTTGQNLFVGLAILTTGFFGAGIYAGMYLFRDKKKVTQLGIEFKNKKWVTLFFDRNDKKDKKNLDIVTNLLQSKAPF
tara:strand:- start:17 stop:628 length:612 start_codon:yes stop_codon:yes gene_type:complete